MICQARNIRQWTGAFEAYLWFGVGQSLSARLKHSKACVLVQAADSMTELFLEEKGFGGGEGTTLRSAQRHCEYLFCNYLASRYAGNL
jgi:hypothetical protein